MSGIQPKPLYENVEFRDCDFHANCFDHVVFNNCVFFDCTFSRCEERIQGENLRFEYTYSEGYTNHFLTLPEADFKKEVAFWKSQPWDIIWNPYVQEESLKYATLRPEPKTQAN